MITERHPEFDRYWGGGEGVRPMARWVLELAARESARLGCGRAELLGDFVLVMNHLLHKFDPDRGVKFPTFYGRYARHHVRLLRSAGDRECDAVNYRRYHRGEALARFRHVVETDRVEDPADRPELLAAADAKTDFWEWVCRGLSPRQKRAVLLTYREGLRNRQVAETMGLPRQRVSEHVRRALETVRKRLRLDPDFRHHFGETP